MLTLSGGTVTAAKTEYRYRDDQQKYIDATSDFKAPGKVVFNTQSGYWELNGLTDLTDTQMGIVYERANMINIYAAESAMQGAFSRCKARTNIPAQNVESGTITGNLYHTFNASLYEILNLSGVNENKGFRTTSFSYLARDCAYLRKILNMFTDVSGSASNNVCSGCPQLEYLMIYNLKNSLNISSCPLLQTSCILYWIQNEAATKAITVTLHADCYTRVMADADIQSALQAHPNIALASA